MDIVKSIYNAPIKYESSPIIKVTYATLIYNNKKYVGIAVCHDNDLDFFSQRVGKRIAASKARAQAMRALYKEYRTRYQIKTQMYRDVSGYGIRGHSIRSQGQIDPTGRIYENILRDRRYMTALKQGYKNEYTSLRNYLKDLDKMIASVKKQRDKDNIN